MEQQPHRPISASAELLFGTIESSLHPQDSPPAIGNGERIELAVLQATPGIPPTLFSVLSKLDLDGDGYLTVSEIQAHVESVKEGSIVLNALANETVRSEMKKFDFNNDGSLKVEEILAAFKMSNDRVAFLKYSLAGLILALLVSFVTLGGLVYYVNQITKESSIGSSGFMFVKGSNQIVQVGSADFKVENGVFYSRESGACSNGTCPSAAPIQTLQALQPLKLSSELDDAILEQMRQMKLTSGASFITFQVLAIARYAESNSRFGSLVVVYTHVGEITLDGEAVFFHETLAGAFSRAGFAVDSTGRRLLGIIEVLGMFNLIFKASKEALARNPAAEVPAALPTEFVARVIFTESCEDKAGRSTRRCELGDGMRANWVTNDAEVGAVLRRDEKQYSLKLAGRRYAKEIATSAQWPGQSVTSLHNETHELVFQTYLGVNYHCALSSESSLLPQPHANDGTIVDMLGYKEVVGVYCRHFRMTIPVGDGTTQAVHLYEDYVRRRLRAVRFGGMQWLFDNLTTIASEAENPLSLHDFDIDAVLRSCDPPGVVPPARIIRGLMTHRLDTESSWGGAAPPPNPANLSNDEPAPSFQADPLRRLVPVLQGNNESWGDSEAGSTTRTRRCTTLSAGLGGYRMAYEGCDTTTTLTLTGGRSIPSCPATSGSVSGTLDLTTGRITAISGSLIFTFKIDCGASNRFPSSLRPIVPTATVTVTAGYHSSMRGASCSEGFSRGVPYLSGEVRVAVGTSSLGMDMRVRGRGLLGLICSDTQRSRDSIRVGISILVTGSIYAPGVSNQVAYYLEPSSSGVCGSRQSGSILPEGIGFDASDGFSYNLVRTGVGQCY